MHSNRRNNADWGADCGSWVCSAAGSTLSRAFLRHPKTCIRQNRSFATWFEIYNVTQARISSLQKNLLEVSCAIQAGVSSTEPRTHAWLERCAFHTGHCRGGRIIHMPPLTSATWFCVAPPSDPKLRHRSRSQVMSVMGSPALGYNKDLLGC